MTFHRRALCGGRYSTGASSWCSPGTSSNANTLYDLFLYVRDEPISSTVSMNTVSNEPLLITLNYTPSKSYLAEKKGCRASVEVQKETPQEGFSLPFTCNATGFRDSLAVRLAVTIFSDGHQP